MNDDNNNDQNNEKPNKPYKVGPGCPPPDHRWKPGQSGNPKGRPPKKPANTLLKAIDPLTASVLEHDRKTLSRVVDGELIEQSRGEAALEAIYSQGLRGKISALRLYWKIRTEALETETRLREEMWIDLSRYKKRWTPIFRKAKREGKPLPRQLPHPDDIILDYKTGTATIVGPVAWSHQNAIEEVVKERDKIIETVLRVTDDPDESDDFKLKLLKNARKGVARCNKFLPPRLKKNIPV